MNSLFCNFNPETVVLCHSDFIEHGKGVGLKGDDREAYFGCNDCHSWWHANKGITPDIRRKMYEQAKAKTHERMRAKGLGHILDQEVT
jgi:hypothetical protein